MRKHITAMMTALAVVAAMPTMAHAADAVRVVASLKLDKVVTEGGKTRHELVTPDTVVPGDKLLFISEYTNVSDKPVPNFKLVNPVPTSVLVEIGSTDTFDVSTDGGKTWGKLAQLTVTKPGAAPRAAEAGDITNVRWIVPVIAPGEKATLQYHAVVR